MHRRDLLVSWKSQSMRSVKASPQGLRPWGAERYLYQPKGVINAFRSLSSSESRGRKR